jgi:hypothetical protein
LNTFLFKFDSSYKNLQNLVMRNKTAFFSSLLVFLLFTSCKKTVKEFLFPVEKDIQLGQQLADYIDANPTEFPLVDSAKNATLYQAMYHFRDVILKSGKVKYDTAFKWKIKVINDDKTLNAFAAPGGFIYIYTGIIQYLDTPEHFAGVMGHEMAHADRRHSVNQMIKNYGIQIIIDIALGSESQVGTVAKGLAGLKFSRSDEADADEWSVEYLCGSQYKANGAAGFFQKLINEGQSGGVPEFLSTHPSPENRVEKINEKADKLGCTVNGEPITWSDVVTASKNIK